MWIRDAFGRNKSREREERRKRKLSEEEHAALESNYRAVRDMLSTNSKKNRIVEAKPMGIFGDIESLPSPSKESIHDRLENYDPKAPPSNDFDPEHER